MKWHFFILIFLLFSINVISQNDIDSLESKLNTATNSQKLDLLISLSKANWNISPQRGINYANKAVLLADKLTNNPQKAKALLYGGVNAWYMGSYDVAMDYYLKSLTIAEEINDLKLSAFNLNNLGMVNSHLGNYTEAISYYSKASDVMKSLGDDIESAKIVNNIGKLHFILGDYNKALEEQLEILDIVKNSDEQKFLLWLLTDIGAIYSAKNNDALAIEYYNESLQLSEDINDNLGKISTLNNLGSIYFKKGDNPKAKDSFNESIKLALKYNVKDELQKGYLNLSEYYEALGNYQKSLENFKNYKALSDSILNTDKIDRIVEMQTKYEAEAKEKENNLLRKNNEIKALELQKQTYLRDFFVALFVFSFLVIIVVYYQFRLKRKSNRELNEKSIIISQQKNQLEESLIIQNKVNTELEQQKAEIAKQAEELKNTNIKLRELDVFKQQMLGMIVHDLKNPLNSILSHTNDVTVVQYSKKILNLVMNILDIQQFEDAAMKVVLVPISLLKMLDVALNEVVFSVQNKNIEIKNTINENVSVYADADLIERVLVNLLTNAVKFTPNNGEITIACKEEDDGMLKILVKDNGAGISQDKQSLIFEKFGQVDAKQLGYNRSTGMGLTFCKLAVEAHNGKIGVDSDGKNGSVFWFLLKSVNCSFEEYGNDINTNFVRDKINIDKLAVDFDKFQQLKFYEISRIRKELSMLPDDGDMKNWKSLVLRAIGNGNEDLYLKLTTQTKL